MISDSLTNIRKILRPLNLVVMLVLAILEFILNPRQILITTLFNKDKMGNLWANVFDGTIFAARGGELIHGHLNLVYLHRNTNQIGPAQVAFWGALNFLSRHLGNWFLSFTQIALYFIFLVFALSVTYHLSRVPFTVSGKSLEDLISNPETGKPKFIYLARKYLALIIVTLFFLLGTPDIFYKSGHWFQVIVIGLWWWAGSIAHKHPILAGTLIGVSLWYEPWGILGGLLLLVATSWRQRFISGTVAIIVGVSAWIPFLLQPIFDLPNYKWKVMPGSIWAYLGIKELSWGDRLMQSVTIIIVAIAFIYFSRKYHSSVWIAWALCILILLTRFATDAFSEPYYWIPLELLLLPGALVLFFVNWKRAVILLFSFWLTTLTVFNLPTFGLASSVLLLFPLALLAPARYLNLKGNLKRSQSVKLHNAQDL